MYIMYLYRVRRSLVFKFAIEQFYCRRRFWRSRGTTWLSWHWAIESKVWNANCISRFAPIYPSRIRALAARASISPPSKHNQELQSRAYKRSLAKCVLFRCLDQITFSGSPVILLAPVYILLEEKSTLDCSPIRSHSSGEEQINIKLFWFIVGIATLIVQTISFQWIIAKSYSSSGFEFQSVFTRKKLA